jgi:hypothetical protein
MNLQVKEYTSIDLLEQLLAGNQSSTIIVSRAAIQAIIKQIQKEQNLTQRSDE